MKITEIYQEYKEKYPEYIILMKIGKFYEVYFEDTKIIHMLTGYRISKTTSDIFRLGFPLNSFMKVTKEFEKRKINYLVLEKVESYQVTLKKRFQKNQYIQFYSKCEKDYEIHKRIDKVYQILLNHADEVELDEILTRIETSYG